jgi:hypothetical protein
MTISHTISLTKDFVIVANKKNTLSAGKDDRFRQYLKWKSSDLEGFLLQLSSD